MLKTIAKSDVKLGMFIHALKGPWVSHPFWRAKFVLQKADDLAALLDSRITAVVIDVAKGADVELKNGADAAADGDTPRRTDEVAAPRSRRRIGRSREADAAPVGAVGFGEEIERAAAVLRNSRKAAEELFRHKSHSDAEALARLRPTLKELSASIARNSSALISLTRERPEASSRESKAVAIGALMTGLARQMGFNEAALHSAGYVGFAAALRESPSLDVTLPGSTQTTERSSHKLMAEGSAEARFPTGDLKQLSKNERAIIAAMGLVCEVYDSMTYLRDAGEAYTPPEAVSQLYRLKQHFDEDVLNAFIRSIGIYPAGSLVQLDTGYLAVVSDQNPKSLTLPTVRCFFCTRRMDWIAVEDVALTAGGAKVISREVPHRWGFADFERDWLPLVIGGKHPALAIHPRLARRNVRTSG